MVKAKQEGAAPTASKRRGKKVVDRWKAKQWYEIHASPEFDNIYIGQTPAAEEEILYQRVLENSLFDFTQDFEDASIKLRFRINKVNGNLANTQFIGHELTRDFIRSLIRRGSNRIQNIIDIKTKDDYVFRITGTVFTLNMAKSSQQKTIRKIISDILTEKGNTLGCKEFVQEMVFGNIERDIKRIANEIVPIRECKLLKSVLLSAPKTDTA
ncbi:MAG: 30S ribosomal protein S3ae [Candidatus Sigynarchaeota archaeon]